MNKKIAKFFFNFGCYCLINAAQLRSEITYPTLVSDDFQNYQDLVQHNSNTFKMLGATTSPMRKVVLLVLLVRRKWT